jgi:hypothetical protein
MVLTLALVTTLATTAHAQVTLPTIALQERSAGSATTAVRPARATRRSSGTTQTDSTRDKTANRHPGDRHDLANDKQRLLDWLVDLQREKENALKNRSPKHGGAP